MPYYVGDPRQTFHDESEALVMMGGALLLSSLPQLTTPSNKLMPLVGTTIYVAVIENDPISDAKRPGPVTQLLLTAPVETAAYVIEAIINYANKYGHGTVLDQARDQARAHYALADR